MKERIKNLLVQGYKASEISSIVGCSPSYISQLLATPGFKETVEAEKSAAAAEKDEETHLEDRYQRVENKILSRVEDELPTADLKEALLALRVVTDAREKKDRRKQPAGNPLGGAVVNGNVHITQIALPTHAASLTLPVVEKNTNNEIIAIGGKSFAPLSIEGVKNLFAAHRPAAPQLQDSTRTLNAEEIEDAFKEI